MSRQKKKIVLIDTNAIIEAHRVKCWNNLASFFQMETVDECIVELGTGNSMRDDYVKIDIEHFRKTILTHKTTEIEKVSLALKYGNHDLLDPGEKYLMAYALNKKDIWVLCSPDKACVRAMFALNFKNRTISLQKLIEETGLKINKFNLKKQYTENWLVDFRTNLLFG